MVPVRRWRLRRWAHFGQAEGSFPLLQRIELSLYRIELLFLSYQGCKWPDLLIRCKYSDSRKISSFNSGKFQKLSPLNRSPLFLSDLTKQSCHQNQAKNGSPKWSEVMELHLKGNVIVLTLNRWDQPVLPCCWEVAACGQAPGSGFAAGQGNKDNLPGVLCLTRCPEFTWLYKAWVAISGLAAASQEPTGLY